MLVSALSDIPCFVGVLCIVGDQGDIGKFINTG